MTPIAIGILALLGVAGTHAILAPAHAARSRALALTIASLVLVPSYGPPPELVIGLHLFTIAVMGVAFLRERGDRAALSVSLPVVPVVFVLYMATSESIGSGIGHIVSEWLRVLMLLMLCLLALRDHRADGVVVMRTILWLVPVQFLIALAEQRTARANVWPRGDAGFDAISERSNELATMLVGRSIGTMGHPILLGTFAVVALVACLGMYKSTDRKRYLLFVPLVAGILVLSGTRSAAVAMLLLVAVVFAFAAGRGRPLRIVLVIAAAVAIPLFDIPGLLGFAQVEQTSSYVHRSRILDSVPRLLDRQAVDVVFGTGGSSGEDLFGAGIMAGYPGYYFFDNQYIRILAFAGVVGLVILVASLIVGAIRTDRFGRLVLSAMVILLASYDVLTWDFSYVCLVLAMMVPWGRSREGRPRTTPTRGRRPQPQSSRTSSRIADASSAELRHEYRRALRMLSSRSSSRRVRDSSIA